MGFGRGNEMILLVETARIVYCVDNVKPESRSLDPFYISS